jgi:hypothetical protein
LAEFRVGTVVVVTVVVVDVEVVVDVDEVVDVGGATVPTGVPLEELATPCGTRINARMNAAGTTTPNIVRTLTAPLPLSG